MWPPPGNKPNFLIRESAMDRQHLCSVLYLKTKSDARIGTHIDCNARATQHVKVPSTAPQLANNAIARNTIGLSKMLKGNVSTNG